LGAWLFTRYACVAGRSAPHSHGQLGFDLIYSHTWGCAFRIFYYLYYPNHQAWAAGSGLVGQRTVSGFMFLSTVLTYLQPEFLGSIQATESMQRECHGIFYSSYNSYNM
jgi:hypothetical protein